ncbi:NrdH-redoxin [Floricoccus tropicus]|uniref:NrdH-redoxin n=1 Tax=Floricoccus tropicus TaxID=1859473 RepID=A0A1E8GMQ4_9LACT|nr:glutaredoxin family protein [Floricoccus tropicus]OFI48808.1 NrdH-redoxin [Floricoccus tropicus]
MQQVKIYTKENCPPCMMTKKHLTSKGIEFQELSILDHIDELKEKGFSSAPVIKVGKEMFSGFNINKIKELILA